MREEAEAEALRAKACASEVALFSLDRRNAALASMAEAIRHSQAAILAANQQDCEEAQQSGRKEAFIDRLTLTSQRLQAAAAGLEALMALPDPLGVQRSFLAAEGIRIEQRRVPFGVLAIIYEARPNVTVDAAGLALKSGNTVVLRGSREARRSNAALVTALRDGLTAAGLPVEAIGFVANPNHEDVDHLLSLRGIVDLAIPRGGAELIERVVSLAKIPVIETGAGVCHIYVHAEANEAMALSIIDNAKTQRPSVCNAVETVLVDREIAPQFLPKLDERLTARGVRLHAAPQALAWMPHAVLAGPDEWRTEHLSLDLGVQIVAGLQEAVTHIERFGTHHSDAIVTDDQAVAQRFLDTVDSACVYWNASTRFTDGFQFGFGAEVGISTQKLHARGPMGLSELTTYKYIIRGEGQVRT
ncbi:MAG: glutamate-5-semialdehyde dehydrogenase [Firmicutes bacterium]|nr:glutamate-5-semialdehyde dehydrogenase [Bacillota bacterium]